MGMTEFQQMQNFSHGSVAKGGCQRESVLLSGSSGLLPDGSKPILDFLVDHG
jgi:hypothetical protein